MNEHTKQHMKEVGIQTFESFLAKHNISDEAEIVPLLKMCWNEAVEAAAKIDGCPCPTAHALLVK